MTVGIYSNLLTTSLRYLCDDIFHPKKNLYTFYYYAHFMNEEIEVQKVK